MASFDPKAFFAKYSKVRTVKVRIHGYKTVLKGNCGDTVDEMAELAKIQPEDVKWKGGTVEVEGEKFKQDNEVTSGWASALFIQSKMAPDIPVDTDEVGDSVDDTSVNGTTVKS